MMNILLYQYCKKSFVEFIFLQKKMFPYLQQKLTLIRIKNSSTTTIPLSKFSLNLDMKERSSNTNSTAINILMPLQISISQKKNSCDISTLWNNFRLTSFSPKTISFRKTKKKVRMRTLPVHAQKKFLQDQRAVDLLPIRSDLVPKQFQHHNHCREQVTKTLKHIFSPKKFFLLNVVLVKVLKLLIF